MLKLSKFLTTPESTAKFAFGNGSRDGVQRDGPRRECSALGSNRAEGVVRPTHQGWLRPCSPLVGAAVMTLSSKQKAERGGRALEYRHSGLTRVECETAVRLV
jgi:hypothetical protein